MPKNTKKAERAALLKVRRKIRKKMTAHRKAKRKTLVVKSKVRSHPHRRTAAHRARKAKP